MYRILNSVLDAVERKDTKLNKRNGGPLSGISTALHHEQALLGEDITELWRRQNIDQVYP